MRNATRFAAGRDFDVLCLGRFAVDFYAQQIGARLEDVTSFAKYLGGSSANTAFGCARLGLRAGLVSRVGDDHLGRFLVETIAREGCDTSHVSVDPARLTGAVVLGIKDRDTFPLIFLRENCADMAIADEDVEESYIARSRALLITGTHFSRPHVDRISRLALERARRNDVRTVLDIDYRPVLWGLTGRGDGETRYVRSDTVTAHLQGILPLFDLVIGTAEEFAIAGGSADLITSLRAIRAVTNATLVIKRGAMGCTVVDGPVPRTIDEAFQGKGVEVEVLNVLGAGDAFSSGFLSGWVRGEDYDACSRYANACGAMVVSRHGCAPAMPTRAELDHFLAHATAITRPDRDATLTRLHRVTAPRIAREDLAIFAFDHRNPFFDLAQQTGAGEERLPRLKALCVEAVARTSAALGLGASTGVLCDDRYGQDALNAATGRGWWIGRPVELPGSNPVVFDRACRQVPGLLPSGRPDRASAGERGADPRARPGDAGHGPRTAARDHPAEGAPARAGHGLPGAEAAVQPGRAARVVETRVDDRGAVEGGRRADRRTRPALPRRAVAGTGRRCPDTRARIPRGEVEPDLPGLRGRPDDLPGTVARVARRRDRRRGARGATGRDLRSADRGVARRTGTEGGAVNPGEGDT